VEASEIDVSDENVVCYLIFSPTLLGINAVREVMVDVMWIVFCPKTFVYIEVWRRDMKMSLLWWPSMLILPWRRRLSPVATRRRLVSAKYFGCLLFKHFILCMCFLQKIWNV